MSQIIDSEHKEKYAGAIGAAKTQGDDSFQSWFNDAKDVHQATVRGFWDFSFHILTRSACKLIKEPENKVALEIGYGGGRILNAACDFFKEGVGVDIHSEAAATEEFLRSNGKTNFKLYTTTGRGIPVGDGSIDFVYSFIVLQHLQSFDALEDYVKETARVLKSGGVAQLYTGRYSPLTLQRAGFLNLGNFTKFLLHGYLEIPTALVNHVSLVVSLCKMKRLCRKHGFAIKGSGRSYKRAPDGYSKTVGGQNYVTLLKK
ncbi:class I SAM-dependent methyltransferase [Candidatus Falkowbacteria bacterium]|nr:class I SAM-dependent methyltransferase [Candidatus Falkowbacteria bacterium]